MTSIFIVANNNYNLLSNLLIKSIIQNSNFDGNIIVCTDNPAAYKDIQHRIMTKEIVPIIKNKQRNAVEKFYNIFKYEYLIDDDILFLDADCYCIKDFTSSLEYLQTNFDIHIPLENPINKRKWWIAAQTIKDICINNSIHTKPYNLNGGLFYIKKHMIPIFREKYYFFEQLLISMGTKVIDELIDLFSFYSTLEIIQYDYDIAKHSHRYNQDLANFWITQAYKTKIYHSESDFYDTIDLKLRKSYSVTLNPSIIHYSGSTEKIMQSLMT